MKIQSLLSEIKSELNKLDLTNIPNVVFISFKSVNSRMKPIADHDVNSLDQATQNELHALLETIQNIQNESDHEKACEDIDRLYQYQLLIPEMPSQN